MSSTTQQRYRVKQLYKALLYLGRDWPQGYASYFRPRLHAAFAKNAAIEDEAQVGQCILRAEYMVKELEAFYFLKKYRHVKRTYGL